jgi:5'-3' exonuclease
VKPIFKTSKHDEGQVFDIDILAIDVSWVAKRHEHALGQRFATSDGRMSGHVYGAYKDISSLLSGLRPRRLAFCYDRGYQWRLDLVPGYKASRRVPEGAEKGWSPGPDVERLFRGFPGMHLSFPDMEADDMIGWLAHKYPDREGPLAIYSKDRDLWQLVHDGDEISCVMPSKSKNAGPRSKSKRFWVNEDVVRKEFGVGPAAVARLKALMGDPSDGTKGLIGARKPGKKDALKAFALDLSSEDYFDPDFADVDLKLSCPDWLEAPLLEERDRLLANFEITSLQHTVDRIDGSPLEETEADLGGALEVLAEFECNSLLAQVDPLFQRHFGTMVSME